MARSPLQEVLARLIEKGQRMLAAAKSRDWDELLAIEAARKADFAQFDSLIAALRAGGAPLPPPVRVLVASILAMENEMIPLVEDARNETLKDLQSVDSSRRLNDLYGNQKTGFSE